MTDAPERIWLRWEPGAAVTQGILTESPEYTPYRRADLSPDWLTNCCCCGRVVDTREVDEGGDSHGAELSDGRWVCCTDCWAQATGEKLEGQPPTLAEALTVPEVRGMMQALEDIADAMGEDSPECAARFMVAKARAALAKLTEGGKG